MRRHNSTRYNENEKEHNDENKNETETAGKPIQFCHQTFGETAVGNRC